VRLHGVQEVVGSNPASPTITAPLREMLPEWGSFYILTAACLLPKSGAR